MKKVGLMIIAVSLSLSVAALAADQPKQERPASKGRTVRTREVQPPKTLANQVAQLKQEQQAAINELQEIKKLATEEKAAKTVAALDKLIARRNQEFQKRIDPLQKRLDAAGRPKPDQPKGTEAAANKRAPK